MVRCGDGETGGAHLTDLGRAEAGRPAGGGATGFVDVDEQIIQQAAAKEGVAAEESADVERWSTFIDRLLESLAMAGGAEGDMVGAVGVLPPPTMSGKDSLRELIRRSIEETADRGDVGSSPTQRRMR